MVYYETFEYGAEQKVPLHTLPIRKWAASSWISTHDEFKTADRPFRTHFAARLHMKISVDQGYMVKFATGRTLMLKRGVHVLFNNVRMTVLER